MNNPDFWKRKLLAFLHDPPNKPYSLREHWEIAKGLIAQAGLSEELANRRMNKEADRMAACADRIAFPNPRALAVKWSDTQIFHHPLGGGRFRISQPIASEADAEDKVAKHQQMLGRDEDYQRNFFLHWRLWPQYCAESDPHLAFLPADTRIPDHTIWTHCSLVSALQACAMDETGQHDSELKPAFLLFEIGPVQDFIEQARTTRDCWSGSYLLSWLMCHGLKEIADREGPDSVLFPSLWRRPLFDFLHKEFFGESVWSEIRPKDEQILTPNFPNRFLALVHADRARGLAASVRCAILEELKRIGSTCLDWFEEKGHALETEALDRWRQQLDQFLQFYWQIWEWKDLNASISLFHQIPSAGKFSDEPRIPPADALSHRVKAACEGIPKSDLDARNYKHRAWQDPESGQWLSEIIPDEQGFPVIDNPGFAWAAHYALTEFYLAGRKNTRDFAPWALGSFESRRGAVKDMFSGKEEVIGSEEWQKGLAKLKTKFLFDEKERLGALNLIKRIWHLAYLDKTWGLKRRRVQFDSIPAIAASVWVQKLRENIKEPAVDELARRFADAASAASDLFPAIRLLGSSLADWLDTTDAAAFHDVEWERQIRDVRNAELANEDNLRRLGKARDALRELHKQIDKPLRYVAVLAMDGDSMGKWLSGGKTPPLGGQLAESARKYFDGNDLLRPLLTAPRHVSPSYHLQFSEALSNFAVFLVAPIIDWFNGQLIYAGGDDVLAMLPARSAFACASALRMAFRGDPGDPGLGLRDVFPGVLQKENEQGLALDWGFVALNGGWDGWSRFEKKHLPRGYPLVVPGRNAEISAGIAMGHMHTPLQALIAAAREAGKKAKGEDGYGKAAFAVNLAKRSGEVLQWGAKWEGGAVELFEVVQSALEQKMLSERGFPTPFRLFFSPTCGSQWSLLLQAGSRFDSARRDGRPRRSSSRNSNMPWIGIPKSSRHTIRDTQSFRKQRKCCRIE
ncbi:MAG: type III-B CRISPR-associated protein Cas10/Cmr2 [Acidobacteria bacterium]|nr:type III-B CRISPR-associated protein Cas10/Cmr2 [Acidobacteriota bacterium]